MSEGGSPIDALKVTSQKRKMRGRSDTGASGVSGVSVLGDTRTGATPVQQPLLGPDTSMEPPSMDLDKLGDEKGDAASPPPRRTAPPASPMSLKLHRLMLVFLTTNLICMLAVVPSRSWGIGKHQDTSLGSWSMCRDGGGAPACDDAFDAPPSGGGVRSRVAQCWAEERGQASASGVFAVFALLLNFVMLLLEAYEYRNPGAVAPFVTVQAALCVVLSVLLFISWTVFWGFRNNFNACVALPGRFEIWYAWGFVYIVAIWCVMIVFTAVFAMKALGKKPPFNL